MTPVRIPIGKYYWGMGASLAALLTGAWLILAPFALGYQAHNAGAWISMTENDFWVGIGVVIGSLAGLVFFSGGLMAELRKAGVLPERPRRQRQPRPTAAPVAAPTVAPARPDLEQTMATLAAALAADLSERRKNENEHVAEPATMGRER